MEFSLVVVRPFGTHAVGDVITDASAMGRILETEHAASVVRTSAVHVPPAAANQEG